MTNYELIKNMTIEEMAEEFIAFHLGHDPWCEKRCEWKGENNCLPCMRKWLESNSCFNPKWLEREVKPMEMLLKLNEADIAKIIAEKYGVDIAKVTVGTRQTLKGYGPTEHYDNEAVAEVIIDPNRKNI